MNSYSRRTLSREATPWLSSSVDSSARNPSGNASAASTCTCRDRTTASGRLVEGRGSGAGTGDAGDATRGPVADSHRRMDIGSIALRNIGPPFLRCPVCPPATRRQVPLRLQVLFVPDVRDGAAVAVGLVAGQERVLAAGHDIVRAHGELAAPWRAPGQAQPQAAEGRLAGGIDHVADDAGAERAIAAAHGQGLAVPATGQGGRGFRGRDQAGLGDGAGDRDEALVEDVLLREHGEVVDLDLAAQAGGAPRRDAVLAGAGGDADAPGAVGEGG